MKYILVSFDNMPKIVFAHCYETVKKNAWKIIPDDNDVILEITAIKKGKLKLFDIQNNRVTVEDEGNVATIIHRPYIISTDSDYHRHFTFAIRASNIKADLTALDVIKYVTDNAEQTDLTAIIPDRFDTADTEYVTSCISKIIDIFNSREALSNIKLMAELTNLLSFATGRCYRSALAETASQNGVSNISYCRKAFEYVAEHISQPIAVEDVALSLNVSYAHLSRLFKKYTNMTLVEYINREKVKKMEEHLWRKKLTSFELAQSVGITDEKYALRLFKKYTGLTVGAYTKLHTYTE
ncbi:MAG: helix-turn-helix transcriptional regulator [Clostridia bacterium]|nr:helix-turn-helix transcriptional regulator [Clostridia bacterium]